MISEELHNYLIEQFKERETELLLRAMEYDGNCRYYVQPIMSDAWGMISVSYDREQGRFVELATHVENGGEVKYETIEL